ncbi:MAG: hypothetical protein P8M61_09235 [Crocinitomicaceae bacterium]|nr:hypothetical protein [Crocinitomicaceae bacterium]MDG2465256.1 hypothetical protein [Crocinitomicaceae bacterium]
MKKIFLITLIFSGLMLVQCKKPESIPAPSNTADLKIHFEGIINGSDVEWTKNVDGYKAVARSQYTPQLTGNLLDLAYYCGMFSNSKNSSIEIGLGSLPQDPTLGTRPTTTTMRTFMNANLLPNFSDTARAGFEILYTDENGRLFRSDETAPGFIEFMDLEEKEDNGGQYIQFKATFSGVVRHWGKTITTPLMDSVLATATIQNATLIGYYTR